MPSVKFQMSRRSIIIVTAVILTLAFLILRKPKDTRPQVRGVHYDVARVNLDYKSLHFRTGFTYLLSESQKAIEPFDMDTIADVLLENEVPLVEAWYLTYARGCCYPDIKTCREALVGPTVIVRLDEKSPIMESLGFFLSEDLEYTFGGCIYFVDKYTYAQE